MFVTSFADAESLEFLVALSISEQGASQRSPPRIRIARLGARGELGVFVCEGRARRRLVTIVIELDSGPGSAYDDVLLTDVHVHIWVQEALLRRVLAHAEPQESVMVVVHVLAVRDDET